MESTRALVQLVAPVMEQSSLIQLSWVGDAAMPEHLIKDRNYITITVTMILLWLCIICIYIYIFFFKHILRLCVLMHKDLRFQAWLPPLQGGLFVGPPGTGKTLLAKVGWGHVVVKESKETCISSVQLGDFGHSWPEYANYIVYYIDMGVYFWKFLLTYELCMGCVWRVLCICLHVHLDMQ